MNTTMRSSGSAVDPSVFEESNRLVAIISISGAVLVSLGVVLALAANWDQIAAAAKIALISVAMAASYAGGCFLKKESVGKPRLGEALIFLGALLYGAGIWVIAQIFHFYADFQTGILLWVGGIIPVALVARSGVVAMLACTLMNIWLFLQPYGVSSFFTWALVSFAVSYLVRSPWSLSKSLFGGTAWIIEEAHASGFSLAFLGLAMCAGYLCHSVSPNSRGLSKPYLYFGPFFLLLALLQLADQDCRQLFLPMSGTPDPVMFFVVRGLCLVALVVALRNKTIIFPEWIGCAAIAIGLICLELIGGQVPSIVLSNALMTSVVLGLLTSAIYRLKSPAVVIIALIFFLAQICMRYFDDFLKLDERSLFFLGGGIMLVGLSYLLERRQTGKHGMPGVLP